MRKGRQRFRARLSNKMMIYIIPMFSTFSLKRLQMHRTLSHCPMGKVNAFRSHWVAMQLRCLNASFCMPSQRHAWICISGSLDDQRDILQLGNHTLVRWALIGVGLCWGRGEEDDGRGWLHLLLFSTGRCERVDLEAMISVLPFLVVGTHLYLPRE